RHLAGHGEVHGVLRLGSVERHHRDASVVDVDLDVLIGAHGAPRARQIPRCLVSSLRWWRGSPRYSSDDFARLKYRCAGCSHVKPMPPWTWIVSAATSKNASEQ